MNRYGRGGFMAFWMLNWIGMLSVYVTFRLRLRAAVTQLISLFQYSGLALESLITVLTPRFIPFFMILWIICELPLLARSTIND
jgi:hypothetical protein